MKWLMGAMSRFFKLKDIWDLKGGGEKDHKETGVLDHGYCLVIDPSVMARIIQFTPKEQSCMSASKVTQA